MSEPPSDHTFDLTIDPSDEQTAGGVSRRTFLRTGALAGAGAALAASLPKPVSADGISRPRPFTGLEEKTIAELQQLMEDEEVSSFQLVRRYIARIRELDRERYPWPGMHSVIQINPDALSIARDLDEERRQSGARGPLHGIPILLKDNIDTADRTMTAAGSLALVGAPATQDSTVAARLRAAGAVILGKAGLSEWANFRGFSSSSGWSGRGGQVRNPYVLDRNPCGSSSGSAAAVSANLCAGALGTETDGSIVCPASANGVVGIKPTVGLTSRAGVVPISHTQDTVGPHGRTVADAAAVLGALTGVDPRDPATEASDGHSFTDYTQFLDPEGLQGTRIGVDFRLTGFSAETDQVFDAALAAMEGAGATIVDVEVPTLNEFNADSSELIVLIYEFKRDLNAYLASRTGVPVHNLGEVIQFNLDHAEQELKYFGQEWMELAEAEIFSETDYLAALDRGFQLAATGGLDATLDGFGLDALVAPTGSPAWPNDLINGDAFLGASSGFAAVARYPLVSVPAGDAFGLPVGVSFMGTAFSEPKLIQLASGFEAAIQARQAPQFLPTVPLDGFDGLVPHFGQSVAGRAERIGARALFERQVARPGGWRRLLHSL